MVAAAVNVITSVLVEIFVVCVCVVFFFFWLQRVLVVAREIFSCVLQTLSCSMWDLVP